MGFGDSQTEFESGHLLARGNSLLPASVTFSTNTGYGMLGLKHSQNGRYAQ